MKRILLVLIYYCRICNSVLASDNNISVTCDHYKMKIANISDHYLKIYATKNGRIFFSSFEIGAGKDTTIYNTFTKNKLKNLKIICRYDNDTYYKDKKLNDESLTNLQTQLQDYSEGQVKLSLKKFATSITAEEVSKIKIDNNDNWFVKMSKNFAIWSAEKTKQAISAYEGLKTLSSNLKNLETKTDIKELIEDIEALFKNQRQLDPFVEKVIKPALDEISKADSYKSLSVYHKKRIITLSQDLIDDYNEYLQKKEIIVNNHTNRETQISSLKDVQSKNSYNAYLLASIHQLDLSTKTPVFTASIDPLIYGNSLNKYWTSTRDDLFTSKNSENKLEWSDGLYNSSFGGSLGVAISPEIRMGGNFFSRFYLSVDYHQYSYTLDSFTYKLSNNFFKDIPANSKGFNITQPFTLDQQNISAILTWRLFMENFIILDLNGGCMRQNGIINLSKSELSSGFSWSASQIPIFEEKYTPFGGLKLILGRGFRGIHLTCEARIFKGQYENNTLYKITETASNKPIEFGSNNLNYKIFVGATIPF